MNEIRLRNQQLGTENKIKPRKLMVVIAEPGYSLCLWIVAPSRCVMPRHTRHDKAVYCRMEGVVSVGLAALCLEVIYIVDFHCSYS